MKEDSGCLGAFLSFFFLGFFSLEGEWGTSTTLMICFEMLFTFCFRSIDCRLVQLIIDNGKVGRLDGLIHVLDKGVPTSAGADAGESFENLSSTSAILPENVSTSRNSAE